MSGRPSHRPVRSASSCRPPWPTGPPRTGPPRPAGRPPAPTALARADPAPVLAELPNTASVHQPSSRLHTTSVLRRRSETAVTRLRWDAHSEWGGVLTRRGDGVASGEAEVLGLLPQVVADPRVRALLDDV